MIRRGPGAGRRLALVTCAGVAVALQASGRGDPTFFLRYFSVWCAILSGSAAAAVLAGWERAAVGWVRDASCAGAVLSGAVYLGVLLPAAPLGAGDTASVWAGNALLHVAVPALAVGEVLHARRTRPPTRRTALSWAVLPAGYVAVTLGLTAALEVAPPYAFLDESQIGSLGVGAAAAAGCGVHLLVAGLLLRRLRVRTEEPS